MADTFATYPSLNDASVIVTGGASGIGADIVRGFAAQGAKVAIIDIDEDSGTSLAAELANCTTPPRFICADLVKFEAFDDLVKDISGSHGAPTILVNNASHDQRHEIGSVTREEWDWSLSINLGHFLFMSQAVIPGMRAAGKGVIVNMSSVTAINGSPALPVYSAAKGAIITLTKTLARKYGEDGIRCNAVAPGAVVTPRQARLWVSPEQQKTFIARQSLHAPVTEVDIANAVLFLASDQAKSITKQVLVVDGGLI
jgi:NAD(P)-dependent dehydrogenase (short-subunit alcohol dehydrogenase family)